MSTNEIITESRTDETQVFRDFSRPSNRVDARTDTKRSKINQMGITEFPSVINTVNWMCA